MYSIVASNQYSLIYLVPISSVAASIYSEFFTATQQLTTVDNTSRTSKEKYIFTAMLLAQDYIPDEDKL